MIKLERHRVCAELKNAKRRSKRLREKAKRLTDEDLVMVLQMRAANEKSKKTTCEPTATDDIMSATAVGSDEGARGSV